MRSLPHTPDEDTVIAHAGEPLPLSTIELNSTLARLWHTDRKQALELAAAEGKRFDRDTRTTQGGTRCR